MEEGRRGAISLPDRWAVEVAGKTRRLPIASLGAEEEIRTLLAIISVSAECGPHVVAGGGMEGSSMRLSTCQGITI